MKTAIPTRRHETDEHEKLVIAAQAGDMAAFTRLVLRFQNLVFGFALSRLRNYHLAQDAAQETFLAAFAGLKNLRDPQQIASWLRGIADLSAIASCASESRR